MIAVAFAEASDPEIEDLHRPVGEKEDVRRFQVTVDEPLRVSRREDVEDPEDDVDRRLQRHRSGAHHGAERSTAEQLHDQKR